MVPYVYFNKICSQPTVQITDFFNKKKFLMQEDLYIYINNLSCFKRSKTLTAKKILPTDIKVSDLQENQLDLN